MIYNILFSKKCYKVKNNSHNLQEYKKDVKKLYKKEKKNDIISPKETTDKKGRKKNGKYSIIRWQYH